MSKKNIILLVGVIIITGILFLIYWSDVLLKRNNVEIRNNDIFPTISVEDEKPSDAEVIDEACIEVTAITEIALGSDLYTEAVNEQFTTQDNVKFQEFKRKYEGKIEELTIKYKEIDFESDSFLDYCGNKVEENDIRKKIEDKKKEFRSEIEN